MCVWFSLWHSGYEHVELAPGLDLKLKPASFNNSLLNAAPQTLQRVLRCADTHIAVKGETA